MMAPQLLYRYGSISKHLVSILLANFFGLAGCWQTENGLRRRLSMMSTPFDVICVSCWHEVANMIDICCCASLLIVPDVPNG
jgi:hypothetical protein